MIDEAIRFLRCPQCRQGAGLLGDGGALRCAAGHCFDIARAGYVSLLPSGSVRYSGDTAAMVLARRSFLAEGHFAGLAGALAGAALAGLADPAGTGPAGHADQAAGCVVDAGAGTGYYLATVLDRLPERIGLALDISKSASRAAARCHQRAAAVRCDAWRPLPVADHAADLVLSVFAPRNGAELARISRPSGRLLVVTPEADHLTELIGPLGMLSVDERKPERLARKLSPHFDLERTREHRWALTLARHAVLALVTMSPSSWHAEPEILAARAGQLPDPVTATVAVRMSVYRPRRPAQAMRALSGAPPTRWP